MKAFGILVLLAATCGCGASAVAPAVIAIETTTTTATPAPTTTFPPRTTLNAAQTAELNLCGQLLSLTPEEIYLGVKATYTPAGFAAMVRRVVKAQCPEVTSLNMWIEPYLEKYPE